MTYQRNMRFRALWVLEDGFDEWLPERVEQAEIAARDHDEAEYDGRRLTDVATVGPLDATQLVDAVTQEGDGAPALAARMVLGRAVAGRDGVALDGVGSALPLVVVRQLVGVDLAEPAAHVDVR